MRRRGVSSPICDGVGGGPRRRSQRSAAAVATATPEPTPIPSPEKELFIYNWDGYIGENTQKQFEDKYGIKVKYDKFPDASTQITKIRSDGKGGGYDLTYPGSVDVAPAWPGTGSSPRSTTR